MVMVRTVRISVTVNRVRVRVTPMVRIGVSVNRVKVRMGDGI